MIPPKFKIVNAQRKTQRAINSEAPLER